jgi:hypothetical protein
MKEWQMPNNYNKAKCGGTSTSIWVSENSVHQKITNKQHPAYFLFPSMFSCTTSLTLTRSVQSVSSYDHGNLSSPFNFQIFGQNFKKSYLASKKFKKFKIFFLIIIYPSQPRKCKKPDQTQYSED